MTSVLQLHSPAPNSSVTGRAYEQNWLGCSNTHAGLFFRRSVSCTLLQKDVQHILYSMCIFFPLTRFCCVQIYIYIYAFSRRFYPKRITIAFRLYIFISTCVPWESNPQPFAQLTQCSTTEPHRKTNVYISS